MISVEFRSVGPGTCHWCRKEKDEVYSVAFSDKSFVGPMCKGDLLRAIGMKVSVEAIRKASETTFMRDAFVSRISSMASRRAFGAVQPDRHWAPPARSSTSRLLSSR